MKLTHHLRCAGHFFARWSVAFLFIGQLFISSASAQTGSIYSLRVEKGTLESAIETIRKTTGTAIAYKKVDIALLQVSANTYRNLSIEQILKKLLSGLPITVKKEGDIYVLLKGTPAADQGERTGLAPKVSGRITGKILDEENGQTVGGASILIGKKGMYTDAEGMFTLSLPQGKYEAAVSAVGYGKKIVTDIDIKDGKITALDITLKRVKGQLSAVVVTGSARKESIASLYARQKNNAAISDGISREQIQRTPDNNVAQVLKRVSGLTITEGKFVTVRGMSERYNNVLLNGASLPSTEPNRRNFSFDIIPSNLIDNVVVNKTATPDLPGEFTGGMVQVNTVDIPRNNFIQLAIGSGFNSNTRGEDFISTRRYSSDYWATKGNQRNWFSKSFLQEYKDAADKFALNSNDNNSLDVLKRRAASIPNNYGLQRYRSQPLQNYQFSLGGSKQFKNESSLGMVLAGSYRHEELIENYDAELRKGPTYIVGARDYNFISAMGAVANIAYRYKGHKITWRNIYNRRFTHETNHRDARDAGSANMIFREYTSVVETGDLLHTRLEGEHLLDSSGIRFDWFADIAGIKKEQPDNRYSQALIEGTDAVTGKPFLHYPWQGVQAATLSEGGVFASVLKETKKNIGGNFLFPFRFNRLQQKLKAGYWGTFRDADYSQIALVPKPVSYTNLPNSLSGLTDFEIFTPENFAKGIYYYLPSQSTGRGVADEYNGKQQIHAFYLMGDFSPFRKLRVIGGLRLEQNKMDIQSTTRDMDANIIDSLQQYNEKNWLPSVNIVYNISPRINIRTAWYKTVARADFRERSPFSYYDFAMRQTVIGRIGLQNSDIENADLRFEWYPGAGEVISVTGFYKKFRRPVELVSFQGADGNYNLFYYNIVDAENRGIEVDLRKSLSFINSSSRILSNIFLSGNFTYMKSEVHYDPGHLQLAADGLPIPPSDERIVRDRPLSGLSPYIINGGIVYQGSLFGANITYNRFGRRVLFGGVDDADDTYENPRDVIDLQLSTRLLKQKLELRFNIADLLHQDFIEYRNVQMPDQEPDVKGLAYNKDKDHTLRRIQRGTNYSFLVSYRF